MLLLGAYLYLFQTQPSQASGILIKVGAVMAVIWLAFPQLESLKARVPAGLIVLAFVCIIVAAARPNLGKVVISVVTIAVAISAVLKWMSKMTGDEPKR